MNIKKQLASLFLFMLAIGCKENQKETSPEKVSIDSPVSSPIQSSSHTYASVDVSPMDMSYFPVDYPKLNMTNKSLEHPLDAPVVRVIYSRPHLQKRHLFRDLLKYDEPWRLGANESTEIDLYKPVTIQGKKIQPGRYILYAIPHKDKWTIVLNSNIDSWGLRPDPTKDIEHFEIPVSVGNPIEEYFTLVFEKTDKGADLVISWDDLVARLPLSF